MDKLLIDSLSERVERLERECRRWRWAGIVAALGAASTVVAGANRLEDAPKTIRAESFAVIDGQGRTKAVLGSDLEGKGRHVLEFLDADGRRRLVAGFDEGNGVPAISLTDPDGREQVAIHVVPKQGAVMALGDRPGGAGVLLVSAPSGLAALGFVAKGGENRLNMGINPDGSSQLLLRDKSGKVSFQVPQP